MPNRAAIRDYVRNQTLIEQDDWGDDKIDAVINQGLRRLSTRFEWPWLAATTTLTLAADSSSATFPTDLMKVEAITRVGYAGRLVEVSPHEILGTRGGSIASGVPTAYYRHGRDMFFDRIPSEDIDFTVLYYKQASTMENDTDEPEFTEEYHLILADYAVAKAWEREEDFTKADEAMNDYEAGVEQMAQFYLDIARDKPIVIGEPRPSVYNGAYSNPNMPFLDGV